MRKDRAEGSHFSPRSHLWLPLLVLAVSLASTLFLWRIVDRGRVERAENRFHRAAQEIVSRISERLRDHEQVLLGGNALFHVKGETVTRRDWKNYVAALNLEENHPGILGVGFAIWLTPADKESHLRAIRAEGFPGYTIRPESERPVYTSIIWLEPFNWRNQRAFGYDMYTEPVRQAAMARARDTGMTSVAAKVVLVQETQQDPQYGMLMYVPSYRQGLPTGTLEERRAALRGFVYSPIRMNDFIGSTLEELPAQIDFAIYAGETRTDATLMFSSRLVANRSLPADYRPVFATVKRVDAYGVNWQFTCSTRPAFDRELRQSRPLAILLIGVLSSILLSLLVFLQARSRRQALTIAEERVQAAADLRRAKNAAEEASRAKSEFLASMSHEIRTPMTVFLAAVEHLLELKQDPASRQLLEMADKSAHRLRALIEDILDFSKIEARRIDLHEEPTAIRSTVEEATALLRLPAGEKGLSLEVAIAPGVPESVIVDPDRLSQVLVNLVGNAVKFTEKGLVKVAVDTDGENLLFAVSDTGPGIPLEKQNLLFQSFSQVDNSRTRRHGGTGLGLAISKGLVELMGGAIRVASRPEQGSTFSFTLPLKTAALPLRVAAGQNDQLATTAEKGARILLAEDEPSVREMIRMILRRRHYRVEAVEDGEQAVSRWREGNFDLILMDLQMPKVDGVAAARTIRRLEEEEGRVPTCIIALTAHARPEIEEECRAAGMDTFITKPIDTRALYDAIEECLAQARPADSFKAPPA